LRRHSRVVCEIALPPRGFRCPGAKRLLGGQVLRTWLRSRIVRPEANRIILP
jgi:hypothetical protein